MPNIAHRAVPGNLSSPPPAMKRSVWHPVATYAAACLLCAYFLTWTYPIRSLNWKIPLSIGGDGLLPSLIAKTLIEDPWFLTNHRLGAPGQLDWYDFPMSDSLHIGLLKLITLFTSSYGLAINAFYLLGFFLVTCTALFVLRNIGLSYASSIVGALLYTFAPYHMFRGEAHLFLACYYVIPLTVWLILKVQDWTPTSDPFFTHIPHRLPRLKKAGAAGLVICILTACSGVYYAFFAVVLLAAVGLRNCVTTRSFARARVALLFASLIGITLVLNTVPNIVYSAQHGRNLAVAFRNPRESEMYGLKILQLILPVDGHRWHFADLIRRLYPAIGPITESDFSSLGIVGSIGFAILLVGSLAGFRKSDERLDQLAFLNLVSVGVGVIGGLGAVFAYFVSAQIRGYTRISIYIAFFSVAAFFIFLEKCCYRLTTRGWSPTNRSALLAGSLVVVLVIGFFDQVSAPDVKALMAGDSYIHDFEAYVHTLEMRLPPGAMVLQLPFMTYPETGPVNDMNAYEPINAYLASSNLRWSYGATRGRFTESWIQDLSSRPAGQLLEYAALSGYQGIYLDRMGYKDHAAAFEQSLKTYLGGQPVEGGGGRFAFYDLRPYTARLHAAYSGTDWKAAESNVRDPIAYVLKGCSIEEHAGELPFRWCGQEARLIVENQLPVTQKLTLKTRVVNGSPNLAQIDVTSPWFNETHELKTVESFLIEKRIEVPPGQSIVRFHSNGTELHAPGDNRRLFFQLQRFEMVAESSRVAAEPPGGCYGLEHFSDVDFRWCQAQADLPIDNVSQNPEPVTVRFRLVTGYPTPAEVKIEGPGFSEKVQASSAGTAYEHTFVLPGGQTHLQITTDAKRFEAPKDPRTLVFQLMDFHVDEKIPPPHVIVIE